MTEATLDLVARGNGLDYRLYLWTPPGAAPAAGWPVLWVLDGSGYRGLAVDAVRNRGVIGGEIEPAAVVAVTYPADDIDVWMTRRWLDLSPSPPLPSYAVPGAAYGGVDAFIDMLADDALPLVACHAAVDRDRMALFGHSMGGLAVLHTLLARPTLFRSWLAISPSLWWNDSALLRRTPVFPYPPRVFIGVGALENEPPHHGVDTAAAMAQRLSGLCTLRHVCLADESHMSVPFAAMRPALDLAFGPAP